MAPGKNVEGLLRPLAAATPMRPRRSWSGTTTTFWAGRRRRKSSPATAAITAARIISGSHDRHELLSRSRWICRSSVIKRTERAASLLAVRDAGRERGGLLASAAPRAGAADRCARARYGRRLHRRAGAGHRRHHPPPAGYWPAIQAVLRKYDVLLIADEVITAFGRTGRMFGCGPMTSRPISSPSPRA